MNQQSAILSGGYSPWQAPLAALFSGISAAAQPGGWSNFGQGVQQGAQNFQQGQQQQQMMDLRRMQIEQAQEEMRRANQEETQRQATIERLRQLGSTAGSSTTPVNPVGGYGAATGGIQTASGSPIAAMFQDNPQAAAIYGGFLDTGDVDGALDFLAKNMPEAAGPAEAPTVKDFYEGGNVVQKQWDGQKWVKVGEGARWEPNAPAAAGEVWERYVDSETGRTGQRNTKTGKIDWDPGNTMMTQVGTDANGNPIFDLVSGSPGPTKEHEFKAANQSLLLGQGLSELERLYNDENVSSWRMAGSEALSENLGPLGSVLGQKVLTAEDKQFISGRARALESLANTITGAAFTEEQKKNFISMLPQPTDDLQTASIKIRQAKEYIAELERNAKVSERRQGGEEGWENVDGVQIRVKP